MAVLATKKNVNDISVLVVGAGGLGAPAIMQLAEAGVLRIGIVDSDRIELSNLHRQIIYGESDIGKPKAQVAAQWVEKQFPGVETRYYIQRFDHQGTQLLDEYDLVLDGTDQFESKLLISDLCTDAGKPYVFAGVVGTEGQVLAVRPHQSTCLRCIFDEAPAGGGLAQCETLGVLGPIAGMVAAEQVRRGLSMFGDSSSCLNEIWTYDGLRAAERSVFFPPASDCRGCGSRTHLRGWLGRTDDETYDELIINDKIPTLSLMTEVCPQTFNKTKRALDALNSGERLWVLIGSDESARNVPVSAMAAGYPLLAQKFDGQVHRLLFEKAEPEGES